MNNNVRDVLEKHKFELVDGISYVYKLENKHNIFKFYLKPINCRYIFMIYSKKEPSFCLEFRDEYALNILYNFVNFKQKLPDFHDNMRVDKFVDRYRGMIQELYL
jgi:hypothetical protein